MSYQISELTIYPIKSLGGISVQKAKVTDKGLQYDRRWMLVNQENRFLTQREIPEMALLQLNVTENGLEVTHKRKNISKLEIPFIPQTIDRILVTVWDDVCEAVAVDKHADKWFSEVLTQPCKLVYMPEDSLRIVDPRYATQQEVTSFSDGYPFLLIGQASLDDLNSRLEEKLPMNRFRPNIVFTGGNAFEEDTWQQFDVNGVAFFPVKPCARCQVITTNQDTAEVGKEPLKTLALYRRNGNKVLFGQNLLHKGSGEIAVGDIFEPVLRKV
jgi:hypothetical protein